MVMTRPGAFPPRSMMSVKKFGRTTSGLTEGEVEANVTSPMPVG